MKVAIFTYKELKELLGKPSEDATRKWVDSRGYKRRNRESSNVKEVLLPFGQYQKLWEIAGRPPEYSSPLSEILTEETPEDVVEAEEVLNAEFSSYNSYSSPEDSGKSPYALSTDFAEEFIKDLAARQEVLMTKNDDLYNRISELTRYEERARILQEEIKKKEAQIESYQNKYEELSVQLREKDVLKVRLELMQELSSIKESEIDTLKEKIDLLSLKNNDLEGELEKEKTKSSWLKKFIGI